MVRYIGITKSVCLSILLNASTDTDETLHSCSIHSVDSHNLNYFKGDNY